jgi:2-dehydro-3-deoxygluconokinase
MLMPTVVTFGELMLRLAVPAGQRFAAATAFDASYGGGEANVAVSLASFGIPSAFVTRLPINELGDGAMRFLRTSGVGTEAVVRGGDRLGLYFLEHGVAQRGSLVVYDRAGSAFAGIGEDDVDWNRAFAGARWFHLTGITPAVSKTAAACALRAVRTARERDMTVSVDLNYRAKLWRWGGSPGEVMGEIVEAADVIIGNEEDAARFFGIEAPGTDVDAAVIDGARYETVARALVARFPRCRTVGITLRGSHSASHNTWTGAMLMNDVFLLSRTYDVQPIVDRVGTGDAFAAGLIAGLVAEPLPDAQDVLEFAVAASCLKHGIVGDANLVTRAEVEQLVAGGGSGRVTR